MSRHEQVRLTFTLDKAKADQFKPELQSLGMEPKLEEGDKINASYTINIDYMGRIAEHLDTIIRLADKGVLIEYSHEELIHGRSILMDVIQKLEALK